MSETSAEPAGLFRQLANIYAENLERIQSDAGPRDEEKRAKVLAIYAKALETLLTLGNQLNAAGAGHIDPVFNAADGLAASSRAADTAELDRNLAQFIGKLVEAGKAE